MCRSTMRKIPKHRISHLHRGRSLKTRLDLEFMGIRSVPIGGGLQGDDVMDLVGGYYGFGGKHRFYFQDRMLNFRFVWPCVINVGEDRTNR